ncbi:MAG: hypothetical protein DRN96_03475 [Thermoproteota archaeon]|nr:MAG: hypothetical protein DRN96_03475 [Candidatus Korarchaeota archaeon]RLG56081.1 MAG: hypothetical protein DRN99_00610 [Candidatus Korarchaeota archaeon]
MRLSTTLMLMVLGVVAITVVSFLIPGKERSPPFELKVRLVTPERCVYESSGGDSRVRVVMELTSQVELNGSMFYRIVGSIREEEEESFYMVREELLASCNSLLPFMVNLTYINNSITVAKLNMTFSQERGKVLICFHRVGLEKAKTACIEPGRKVYDSLSELYFLRSISWREGVVVRFYYLASDFKVEEVEASFAGYENLTVPAGSFSCVRVFIKTPKQEIWLWISLAPPHPIVQIESRGEEKTLLKLVEYRSS